MQKEKRKQHIRKRYTQRWGLEERGHLPGRLVVNIAHLSWLVPTKKKHLVISVRAFIGSCLAASGTAVEAVGKASDEPQKHRPINVSKPPHRALTITLLVF